MSETLSADEGAAGAVEITRPGRVLAEARARKGLSLADVALQLKLSISQVEALEAEAYDRLPGAVFVRGFVRNYARLMELDAEPLVAALELEQKGTTAMAAVPRSHNIPFPARGRVKWPAYLAVLLLLIVAVVVADLLISAPPAVVVARPVAEAVPETAAVPAPVTVAPVQEPSAVEAVTVATLQSPAEPEKSQPAAPAPAPAPVPGQGELHFAFSSESWVEVRDANGRILFSQLNPAGSEQHVQGRSPFDLVVGNARGVRLTYNGRTIDLAPHTRVEVARLTLE